MRTRILANVPRHAYNVVYADFPWAYEGDPNKDQAAGKHYSMMQQAEINAFPLPDFMAKQSVALIWATCPKLHMAFEAIRAWNLCYRGVFKNWVKCRLDGVPINGQGVRPTASKPTSELLLLASFKPTGRPLPIFDEGMAQMVFEGNPMLEARPKNKHSAKPTSVRDDIVKLWGDVSRIELFARDVDTRFDAWGNEV